MWMAKVSAAAKTGQRSERSSRHHSTRRGVRDTEVKELMVIPSGPAGLSAVTMQTPVAKAPSARR